MTSPIPVTTLETSRAVLRLAQAQARLGPRVKIIRDIVSTSRRRNDATERTNELAGNLGQMLADWETR
jgi:hypothetical protein